MVNVLGEVELGRTKVQVELKKAIVIQKFSFVFTPQELTWTLTETRSMTTCLRDNNPRRDLPTFVKQHEVRFSFFDLELTEDAS